MESILESLSKVKTDSSVIPESCLSFSEMSDYIDIYGNVIINKANCESFSFEKVYCENNNGKEIVYEGENLEYLNEVNMNSFTSTWSVRKDFWTKVFNKFKKKVKDNNSLRIGNINLLSDDKPLGSIHTFFTESIKFDKNYMRLLDEADKRFKNIKSKEQAKETSQDIINKSFFVISGCDGSSRKLNMRKSLRNKLLGDIVKVNKKYIKDNTSYINSILSGTDSDKYIKEAYNNEKRIVASTIKKVQEFTNSNPDYSNIVVNCYSKMLSTLFSCYSIEMDVLMRKFNEAALVAAKANKYNSK